MKFLHKLCLYQCIKKCSYNFRNVLAGQLLADRLPGNSRVYNR